MITDITGIELTPSNSGIDCLGNGLHYNENGELIECCCEECDYMLCCFDDEVPNNCDTCNDLFCPHAINAKKVNKIQKRHTKQVCLFKFRYYITCLPLR